MKQENTLDAVNVCLNLALAEELLNLLCVKKYKIGIAESCTGGLLSYHFTALSGASSVLDGAMISYANEIKHSWLGVSEADLQEYGAVSEPVVRAMCAGILKKSRADVALATSGVAGPTGGSVQKPVGCVYIGAQIKGQKALVERCQFGGDRYAVQSQSCAKALQMLLTLLSLDK
ncbi:CinA family protein [Helicobacter japonicus]|uniref:CinA family protein n=1 Tax=Helicobacter japonicus TaxID=425400 RepID=UPI0023F2B1AC|nr:CinA family protein [Helicobacter japonicus]